MWIIYYTSLNISGKKYSIAIFKEGIVKTDEGVFEKIWYSYGYYSFSKYSTSIPGDTWKIYNKKRNYFMNLYIDDWRKNRYLSGLQRDKILITTPYMDTSNNKYVFTIAKRIYSQSESAVALDIRQDKIDDLLKGELQKEGPVLAGMVLDQNGIVMGYTHNKYIGQSILDSSLAIHKYIRPYTKKIMNEEVGSVEINVNHYVYTAVHKKTQSGWHVVYLLDQKTLSESTVFY